MHEVIELDLETLGPELLKEYQKLTEPRFYSCFKGKDPWDITSAIIFAIAAVADGKPVGLALVSYKPVLQIARLVSIFVAEPYRGHHIGTALITKMEEVLRREKCRMIQHLYLVEQPTTQALEKIFVNLGWSQPRLMMIKCYFDAYVFNPPWFRRDYPVPKGFELFPWKKLRPKERALLQDQEDHGVFSYDVSPFYNEKTIESINSLGLRNADEVVGWMITHRVDKHTIQYSSLYVQREYKYLGHSMCLLVNSIRMQQRSPVQFSVLDLNVPGADSHWLAFVKRRLVPYTTKVERLRESVHQISK